MHEPFLWYSSLQTLAAPARHPSRQQMGTKSSPFCPEKTFGHLDFLRGSFCIFLRRSFCCWRSFGGLWDRAFLACFLWTLIRPLSKINYYGREEKDLIIMVLTKLLVYEMYFTYVHDNFFKSIVCNQGNTEMLKFWGLKIIALTIRSMFFPKFIFFDKKQFLLFYLSWELHGDIVTEE